MSARALTPRFDRTVILCKQKRRKATKCKSCVIPFPPSTGCFRLDFCFIAFCSINCLQLETTPVMSGDRAVPVNVCPDTAAVRRPQCFSCVLRLTFNLMLLHGNSANAWFIPRAKAPTKILKIIRIEAPLMLQKLRLKSL